jgi:hypothetical protein
MAPEVPMTRSHVLVRGPRVRLRIVRPGDRAAIRALLGRIGARGPELEAARLVRTDPRHRLVVVATGLVGSAETVLGVGEIELDADRRDPRPRTYVDDVLTGGLDELLANALIGRARSRAA